MGKLITFWSPYAGRSGTTTSMSAVSAMFGMLNPEAEIAVCQFGEENGLHGLTIQGKKELIGKTGISALKMNYMQSALTSERIRRCAIPMLLENMYLFPCSGETNDPMKNQILGEKIVQEFDVTFLDLPSVRTADIFWFMEKADFAVVVLPQSVVCWNDFFQNYFSGLRVNEVNVILGKYLPDSKYNESFFARKREYRGKAKVIGSIPVSAEFMDAMEEGSVLDFCLKNEFVRKKEEHYEFMEHTREIARRIGADTNTSGSKKIFAHRFV